jgi:hypothetical protein
MLARFVAWLAVPMLALASVGNAEVREGDAKAASHPSGTSLVSGCERRSVAPPELDVFSLSPVAQTKPTTKCGWWVGNVYWGNTVVYVAPDTPSSLGYFCGGDCPFVQAPCESLSPDPIGNNGVWSMQCICYGFF